MFAKGGGHASMGDMNPRIMRVYFQRMLIEANLSCWRGYGRNPAVDFSISSLCEAGNETNLARKEPL